MYVYYNFFKLTNYLYLKYEIFYKGQQNTAASITEEINRTMVFQIGRNDLRLISPDRKQILLHKHLKDVINCFQV